MADLIELTTQVLEPELNLESSYPRTIFTEISDLNFLPLTHFTNPAQSSK